MTTVDGDNTQMPWKRIGTLGGGVALCAVLVACTAGPNAGIIANSNAYPGGVPENAVEERMTMRTDELHQAPEGWDEAEAAPVDIDDGDPWSLVGYKDPTSIDYQIGAGDILEFQSWDDPSLSRENISVRYDGHISLPLVPDINIHQRTREEATEMIRHAYEEVFIEPQISLRIVESLSKSYYVMGEVQQPGEFAYRRTLNLLEAINQAGGPRINRQAGDAFVGAQGQLAKAFVIRVADEERNVIEYDLRNLSDPGPHASMAPIIPGDVVYVPEGVNLVYILGQVTRPNVYALPERTTMLQMLALAGGIDFSRAKLRRVVLIREISETESEILLVNVREILRTGQDIFLQPGDVIYVPQRDLVRLQEFVGRFTGSVSPMMALYRQAIDTYYAYDLIKGQVDRLQDTGQPLDAAAFISNLGNILPTQPVPGGLLNPGP